jgi:hypothetical protein
MKGFLRRLRGIIGMGLTWGAGLGVVGSAIGLLGFLTGDGFVTALALTGAFVGFVAGSSFGTILSLTEGGRGLADLSLKRVALWGGLGGALVACATNLIGGGGLVWDFVVTLTVLGAGLSSGSVAMAKRAHRKELSMGEDELPALEGKQDGLLQVGSRKPTQ